MPHSKVAKAILGMYLAERDKENKLNDNKKLIALELIAAADKITHKDQWIDLVQDIAKKWAAEVITEAGYSWMLRLIVFRKQYLFAKALHATLAYLVDALDKEKAWDDKTKAVILDKNFDPNFHKSYFHEILKSDPQSAILAEQNFDDFHENILADKRNLSFIEKYYKPEPVTPPAEIKPVVSPVAIPTEPVLEIKVPEEPTPTLAEVVTDGPIIPVSQPSPGVFQPLAEILQPGTEIVVQPGTEISVQPVAVTAEQVVPELTRPFSPEAVVAEEVKKSDTPRFLASTSPKAGEQKRPLEPVQDRPMAEDVNDKPAELSTSTDSVGDMKRPSSVYAPAFERMQTRSSTKRQQQGVFDLRRSFADVASHELDSKPKKQVPKKLPPLVITVGPHTSFFSDGKNGNKPQPQLGRNLRPRTHRHK